MKQRPSLNRRQLEEPIWCEHCRLRIAPYEEAATEGRQSFHKSCFQKEQIWKLPNLDEHGIRVEP